MSDDELSEKINDILYFDLSAISESCGCCAYIDGRPEALDNLIKLFYEWESKR